MLGSNSYRDALQKALERYEGILTKNENKWDEEKKQRYRDKWINRTKNEIQANIIKMDAAKALRLKQEADAIAAAKAPQGGQWVGGAPAYTHQGQGGGEYTHNVGNQTITDYHDPYDPGGGEKDGGLIGYKDGGLATMFTRRR